MNAQTLLALLLLFFTGSVMAQTERIETYSDWTSSFETTSSAEDEVAFYPNPAADQLTISLPVINPNGEKAQVAIYDLCGNLVKTNNLSDGQRHQLSVAGLPNGLYIINVIGEDFKFSDRLVVQH